MTNPGDSVSRGSFSLPTGPNFHSSRPATSASHTGSQKKPWQGNTTTRRTSLHSNRSHPRSLLDEHRRSRELAQTASRTSGVTSAAASANAAGGAKWWRIHYFQGMMNDIRRRGPYYLSDWTDAWDYRVIPATVYMYFAKYDPDKCNFFSLFEIFPISVS